MIVTGNRNNIEILIYIRRAVYGCRRDAAPVAQLAWKLTVAVVDTARVLHVFVAVVAVREHFAAVLTLIPVTRLFLRVTDAVPTCMYIRYTEPDIKPT